MEKKENERKRGDASYMIIKWLQYNGPATYEQLAKELDIPQDTVEYGVRDILFKRHKLIRHLPNGRYA